MNQELLTSEAWKPKKDEPLEIFASRIATQKTQLQDYQRKHGKCYMVRFADDDIRPMWEDTIDTNKLRAEIPSPSGFPFECPMCQPYDLMDATTRQIERKYMTKIVNPAYPEGFIDMSGVWIKCPCLIKGEDRKWLKFIRKELK